MKIVALAFAVSLAVSPFSALAPAARAAAASAAHPANTIAAVNPNTGNTAVSDDPCGEVAQPDANGEYNIPGTVGGIAPVNEDHGLVSALYPGRDTKTDAMYPLPCEPSIGGTIPPLETPSAHESGAADEADKFDAVHAQEIADHLEANMLPPVTTVPTLPQSTCMIGGHHVPCDSPSFLRHDQPFEGRDIIFVHGLALDHIKRKIAGHADASATWPEDPGAFLHPGSYFRKYAEDYWREHIHENLADPDHPGNPIAGWEWWSSDQAPVYRPKSNRYLIVAWSSNQTLEYGQSAVLEQIRRAMRTGLNVVTPPGYPSSHVRPFCANKCIIISHSTGALLATTLMARAQAGFYGPGGVTIAKHMLIHVSFEGAISGSRLATAALAVALAGPAEVSELCATVDDLLQISHSCQIDLTFLQDSVLRDLVPLVSQLVWGPYLNHSPVPTVTVAGGHPSGDHHSVTKMLLPGLDDGVVSMNSACGNPNKVIPFALAPSGAIMSSPVKAFDFSDNAAMLARAAKNYLSQINFDHGITPAPLYLAGACTPYLSPTGMVMPVLADMNNTVWNARKRYKNHYSFIQGVLNHSYDPGDYDVNNLGLLMPDDRFPSAVGLAEYVPRHALTFAGVADDEETSAVTDQAIYQQFSDGTYLVHPSFAAMHEIVRGKSMQYWLLGKWHRAWIWKRTYHLLDKWEKKQSCHYVYEFVGRR